MDCIKKEYFEIDEIKPKQYEIIDNLLNGNDVIGLLPTGYGKSLCYILPSLLTKKTTFIISRLIALMDDQKEKLTKNKIKFSSRVAVEKFIKIFCLICDKYNCEFLMVLAIKQSNKNAIPKYCKRTCKKA